MNKFLSFLGGTGMVKKIEYIRKMNSKLDQWSSDIYNLSVKADQTKAPARRTEYNRQIDELRNKRVFARKQLHTLEKASEDAWEDMKSGIEETWSSLEYSVNLVKSGFR